MSTMPFGKYVNLEIEVVPSDYLWWLLDQGWFHDDYESLVEDIKYELDVRTRSYAHFYKDRKD